MESKSFIYIRNIQCHVAHNSIVNLIQLMFG